MVVAAAGSDATSTGAVAAEHLRTGPAVQLHQVTLGAAAIQPGLAVIVPELVREQLDIALAATAGDDLVDAAGDHRAADVDPEPQVRPERLGMPGSDTDVPVQAARRRSQS